MKPKRQPWQDRIIDEAGGLEAWGALSWQEVASRCYRAESGGKAAREAAAAATRRARNGGTGRKPRKGLTAPAYV